MKLINQFHPVPSLRMCGVLLPLSHVFSRCGTSAQGQIYFIFSWFKAQFGYQVSLDWIWLFSVTPGK
jgi:hypothetical protein